MYRRYKLLGKWGFGIYCGESMWRVSRWYTYYGLFRRVDNGFSIGPVLFYKGE